MAKSSTKKEKKYSKIKQVLTDPTPSPPTLLEKKTRKPGKCPIHFEKKEDGNGTIVTLNAINEEESKKNATDFYNELLTKLTGTSDIELAHEIIVKGRRCIWGYDEAGQNNIILQSLAEQQPKDQHEARLCIQASVLYSQAMKYLQRAEGALDDGVFDKQGWHQIFMKHATRLLDLHTRTVEALTRYRQKGEQRIVVQHINVTDNAKAIVSGQMIAGGEGQQ